jgi:hypothetical protein
MTMSKRDQLNAEITRRVAAEAKVKYAEQLLEHIAAMGTAPAAPPAAPPPPPPPPPLAAPPAPPPSLSPTWDAYHRETREKGQYAGYQFLLNQDARTLSAETAARLAAGVR